MDASVTAINFPKILPRFYFGGKNLKTGFPRFRFCLNKQ